MLLNKLPENYLKKAVSHHKKRFESEVLDPKQQILVYSGALLTWVGEYSTDESIEWTLEKLPVDSIYLTGAGPDWNEYLINQSERDPKKFRELLKDPTVSKVFESAVFETTPILIRVEDEKLKVLDRIDIVVAAIRDGRDVIEAYVGRRHGDPQPVVEPHVLYDFIRAYHQGRSNAEDCKAGLRFLMNTYVNVRKLLEERFNETRVFHEDLQKIIKEVLEVR